MLQRPDESDARAKAPHIPLHSQLMCASVRRPRDDVHDAVQPEPGGDLDLPPPGGRPRAVRAPGRRWA
eukprot:6503244-Prymnesium_polylepis.1